MVFTIERFHYSAFVPLPISVHSPQSCHHSTVSLNQKEVSKVTTYVLLHAWELGEVMHYRQW